MIDSSINIVTQSGAGATPRSTNFVEVVTPDPLVHSLTNTGSGEGLDLERKSIASFISSLIDDETGNNDLVSSEHEPKVFYKNNILVYLPENILSHFPDTVENKSLNEIDDNSLNVLSEYLIDNPDDLEGLSLESKIALFKKLKAHIDEASMSGFSATKFIELANNILKDQAFNDVMQDLTDSLRGIRFEVQRCLAAKGYSIITSQIEPADLLGLNGKGWRGLTDAFVSHNLERATNNFIPPSAQIKYCDIGSVRPIRPFKPDDHGVNIAPEYVFNMVRNFGDVNELWRVSIAEDRSDWKTLKESGIASRKVRQRMVRDAMRAVIVMQRKYGFSHCDIKPENIFVVKENGRYLGKLFDFESYRPFGASPGPEDEVFGTNAYKAWSYFSCKQALNSYSQADVFAFGLTILDEFVDINEFYQDWQQVRLQSLADKKVYTPLQRIYKDPTFEDDRYSIDCILKSNLAYNDLDYKPAIVNNNLHKLFATDDNLLAIKFPLDESESIERFFGSAIEILVHNYGDEREINLLLSQLVEDYQMLCCKHVSNIGYINAFNHHYISQDFQRLIDDFADSINTAIKERYLFDFAGDLDSCPDIPLAKPFYKFLDKKFESGGVPQKLQALLKKAINPNPKISLKYLRRNFEDIYKFRL